MGECAVSDLTQAMREYADAIRGDWSDFDGRSEKHVILSWVDEIENPSNKHDLEWWRNQLGLCPDGNGHWAGRWGYCTPETCPKAAAEGWL